MLVVETIAKVRRADFVDGKSIKQIYRDLQLSRNTVRKVVRSGEAAFSYDRSVQPRPKIDPWRDRFVSRISTSSMVTAMGKAPIKCRRPRSSGRSRCS